MKTKKTLTLLLIFFICSYGIALAQCGPNQPCVPCKQYPYKVCTVDEKGKTKIQTVCTAKPDTLSNIGTLIKVDLPITINLTNGFSYGVGAVSPTNPEPGGFVLTPSAIDNDLEMAANKWNCICGFNTSQTGEQPGTTITAKFSSDWRDFDDPYNDPSNYKQESCNDHDSGIIYFNDTKEYKSSIPSPDNDMPVPEELVTHILMNREHIENYYTNYLGVYHWFREATYNVNSGIREDLRFYSFADVAIRAIGDVLGMGYSEDCGCSGQGGDYSPISVMEPDFPQPFNGGNTPPLGYHGLGGADNDPSGDCDKCMFQKLYCESEPCPVGIYESNKMNVYISPNPTANYLDVKLNDVCKKIAVEVVDLEGKSLFKMNFEGTKDFRIEFPFVLPNGTYSLLLNADNIQSTTNFIIKK